ncbi:hypothetical protein ACE1SV_01930 [Streptomyces sennicomposti]
MPAAAEASESAAEALCERAVTVAAASSTEVSAPTAGLAPLSVCMSVPCLESFADEIECDAQITNRGGGGQWLAQSLRMDGRKCDSVVSQAVWARAAPVDALARHP